MILSFFKNKLFFAVLFFSILGLDIGLKLTENEIPSRFFTKSTLIILLLVYFFQNKKGYKKDIYIALGLLSFWIGDMFLLLYENQIYYILGLVMFMIGKLLYIKRFSHQNDFKMSSLTPYLISIFAYMSIIILLVYDNLGDFFFPVLCYLFIAMLMALFAVLRRDSVDKKSFLYVILGVLFIIVADSIGVLQSFYNPDLAYHKVTIMLFYGLFQYFVIIGITKEKFKIKD